MRPTRKFLIAAIALAVVFCMMSEKAMAENRYIDFLTGKKKLGFKPTGKLNKEVYWYITHKYPMDVSDKTLFQGSKDELKELLTGYHMDSSGVDSLKANGKILVKFLEKYRSRVSMDLAVFACANGMVRALNDPGCMLVLPSKSKDSSKELAPRNYAGVGILIEKRWGKIIVIHPFKGGAAKNAGIQAGDVILSVKGKSVKSMSLDDVMNAIRGPAGSKASLVLARRGKKFKKTLVRSRVNLSPIYAGILDNGMGYVKIVYFGEKYPRKVYEAINKFKSRGVKKWILDLRDNSGGHLNNIIVMGSIFVPPKKPIMYIKYKGREKKFSSAARRNMPAPAAVLVNGYTTGSAEILAAALREYKGSRILGSKTRGNAAVSEFFKLSDGVTLKLTVGEMLTGRKKPVHKVGVKPDVEIKGVNNPANTKKIFKMLMKSLK